MIGVSDKGSDVQVISSTSPYGLIGTFDSDGDNNKHTILEFSRDSSQILMCTNDKKAKVYTVSTGNKDF